MKPTGKAQTALDHYRRATGPRGAAGERVLANVHKRMAAGEIPAPLERLPAALRARRRWPAKNRARAPHVVGGLCVLALAVAWFWRANERHRPLAAVGTTASSQARAPEIIRPDHEAQQPLGAAETQTSVVASASGIDTPSSEPPTPSAGAAAGATAGGVRSGVARRRTRATATHPAARSGESNPATEASSPESTRVVTEEGVAQAIAGGDLQEELRLMRMAHDALRAGRPERALASLAEHATRFPSGVLGQSRQMTRIMALCQGGQVARARAEAQRFLVVSANSPYAARVRSLCSEGRPALRTQ